MFPGVMGPRVLFLLRSLRDVIVGDIRPALLVISGAVLFFLLMTCANAASLLLVKGITRNGETATRAALGAGRWRLVCELIVETALLSFSAAVLGLLAGCSGVRLLLASYPGSLPIMPHDSAAVDPRVAMFAVAACVLTTLIAGITPAWIGSRADLVSCFKQQNASSIDRDAARFRSFLVGAQVVAAMVLVIGSGLLMKTFLSLHQDMRALNPASIITLRVSLTGQRFERTRNVHQFLRDTQTRVASAGSVSAIAATSSLPFEPVLFALPFTIWGREQVVSPYHGTANWRSISSEYFRVFRIHQRAGRPFSDSDDTSTPPVAIINSVMAKKYWAGTSPIGEKITLGAGLKAEFNEPAREIVGVVDDLRDLGLQREAEPMVYVPIAQVQDRLNAAIRKTSPLTLAIRTTSPDVSRAAIRNAILNGDGPVAAGRFQSMEEVLSDSTARAKFNTILITVFGALALIMAGTGIYGVISYSVEQRRREFGIRVAVGATPREIGTLILRGATRVIVPSICIGFICAHGLAKYLDNIIFGMATMTVEVATSVLSIFLIIAAIAAYAPVRRALRIGPGITLRD
jgi:predicted permease